MKKVVLGLLVVALFIPASGMSKKKDKDLVGTYSVRGFNPGVSTSGVPSYTGNLEITQSGGAYFLNWTINDGGKAAKGRKGVGIYAKKILSVGLDKGGVISYEVEKSVLKGVWAPPGGGAFGYEICRRN